MFFQRDWVILYLRTRLRIALEVSGREIVLWEAFLQWDLSF